MAAIKDEGVTLTATDSTPTATILCTLLAAARERCCKSCLPYKWTLQLRSTGDRRKRPAVEPKLLTYALTQSFSRTSYGIIYASSPMYVRTQVCHQL